MVVVPQKIQAKNILLIDEAVGSGATLNEISEKLKTQIEDVNLAIEELSAKTQNNLWEAIGEWEFLLEQKSLSTTKKPI